MNWRQFRLLIKLYWIPFCATLNTINWEALQGFVYEFGTHMWAPRRRPACSLKQKRVICFYVFMHVEAAGQTSNETLPARKTEGLITLYNQVLQREACIHNWKIHVIKKCFNNLIQLSGHKYTIGNTVSFTLRSATNIFYLKNQFHFLNLNFIVHQLQC